MSAEDESSWRLLFNISLSHGRALQLRQLTWEGWMVFLSSAKLIGITTGVFPVLLDQLWQRQSLSAKGNEENEARDHTATSPTSAMLDEVSSSSASDAFMDYSETASPDQGTGFVEFGGFVDMMKVLCVRVFQTFQVSSLRETQGDRGDCLLQALRRGAEDRVQLTEAVHFTASRYLRPFIAKSTIHASSKVCLRASSNGWALHVNRLVTHIVGALAQSVILPVYRAYANTATGRMAEGGFRQFLRDYLPGLDAVEETCALAIFERGGFPDIRPLVQALQTPPEPTTSSVSSLASARTLGLTDFMEALLMLAVVVSANETRHPHLRAITAKVWVFFDRFLCHGTGVRAPMCVDPYMSGRYAALPPGLVSVYPTVVTLLPCPTLLVEVCNAAPCSHVANTASSSSAADMQPPTPSRVSAGGEKTPFLTEVSTLDAATPSSFSFAKDGATAAASDVAVDAAAPLFASQWSLLERNADVPLFGEGDAATVYEVTVGGTAVEAARTSCPDIWSVNLAALSLDSVKLIRCAVEAAPTPRGTTASSDCDGDGSATLIFTPIRSLPVELALSDREPSRFKATERNQLSREARELPRETLAPWGCKDVVFTDTSVNQVVSGSLMNELHALLDAAREQPSSEAAATATAPLPAPAIQTALFSVDDLCGVCRRLKWCETEAKDGVANLDLLCSQAVTSYRQFQRTLHPGEMQSGFKGGLPFATSSQKEGVVRSKLSLLDILGCMSVLLLRTNANGLRDIPNVPRRLEMALLAASAAPATSPTADHVVGAASLRSLPHNRLRDEPFKLALERKEVQSSASRERRAALIKALQDHHVQQLSSFVALPPLPETRPSAMRLVSQNGNVDPATDFQQLMLESAEALKAHFIERELAIPEWRGR